MTLRDDLQPCVDDARSIIGELGLRPHVVVVRTRTWDGGRPGSGTATDVDVTITPAPRVRGVSPRLVHAAPGKYEDGDRVVDKISRTYAKAALAGTGLAAGQERWVLIDGDPYRVIGEPEERSFEWRLQVRRITR